MSFVAAGDANGTGNGDVSVRTDKGRLVAVIYAQSDAGRAAAMADVIAAALNAAFAPEMTDLMLSPDQMKKAALP